MKKIMIFTFILLLPLAVFAERWEFNSLVGDTIYDPILGPPPWEFSQDEPPPIPPYYYDWDLYAIPDSSHWGVFPSNINIVDEYFIHP